MDEETETKVSTFPEVTQLMAEVESGQQQWNSWVNLAVCENG